MASKMLMLRNNFSYTCIKYEKEKLEPESLTTLNWPLTSTLKELAVQCRLPHGKINWTLLHNEFGQVGIGKWGKNCAHHFKPIKNTRQYKKWVLERRSRANGFRQYVSAIPIPIGDRENVDVKAKADDNVGTVSRLPEVTNTTNIDPAIGDVSTETYDSFFNDSKTEEVLEYLEVSPIKAQADQNDCSPVRCHYGDGDVKVKDTLSHVTSDLSSDSTSAKSTIPAVRGLEWRDREDLVENENLENEEDKNLAQTSNLETDVREFLSDLIEEVCDLHEQKLLSSVVMRLVRGDTSSKHFLYMPSNLDLGTRDLEEAMRKLTLEVSAPGSDDCTAEFNISINTVGTMIEGCDVVDDGSHGDQGTDRLSAQRPTRKVTVSVAKVLEELDKYRAEDQFLSGATPASSVSCGTLPVMMNKESSDSDAVSRLDGLDLEGTNILRVSLSSPNIMMTSPFIERADACSDEPTHNAKTTLEKIPSLEEVIRPVSLDSVEREISPSSSISSLVNDPNDVYDYNADTEEDLDEKTPNEGRRSNGGSSTNSRNSSCSDVVRHANPGFLLDKSVNEADLEVIELGQGQTGVMEPVTESDSATSTVSTASSSGSSESSSQESMHDQGSCHVS